MIGMEIYMVEMIPMMPNRNPTDAVNASFEHDHFFRPWIGARSQLGEACKPKGTLYAENSGPYLCFYSLVTIGVHSNIFMTSFFSFF